MIQAVGNGLQLPFKPFTADEVQRITKCSMRVLDLCQGVLHPRTGMGATGLDYMQTFAVFVGQRWLDQGASEERAQAVVKMVARMGHNVLLQRIRGGDTFPCTPDMGPDIPAAGLMVRPPNSKMGRDLNLKELYLEFTFNLKQVFPGG